MCDTGCFADNFEWLAERAMEWRRSDRAKARWLSGVWKEYEANNPPSAAGST
ncbi:hypothetical protein [Streptomyces sp. NPDC051776]|uniref:hypothetical protein n=1 Tax=Streptomyces sp. NPDC051776 TaxID=3155414 RepID=UPI003424F8CC